MRKFWKDVSARLKAIKKQGDRMLALVDANCRTPDLGIISPLMGSVLSPAWRANFVSEAFLEFAVEHSLHIATSVLLAPFTLPMAFYLRATMSYMISLRWSILGPWKRGLISKSITRSRPASRLLPTSLCPVGKLSLYAAVASRSMTEQLFVTLMVRPILQPSRRSTVWIIYFVQCRRYLLLGILRPIDMPLDTLPWKPSLKFFQFLMPKRSMVGCPTAPSAWYRSVRQSNISMASLPTS